MIWQEIPGNGAPRRPPIPTLLALVVEASTSTPKTTRAIVASTVRPAAEASIRLAPFYICNTERLSAMYL